jgi:energy-coupling factor transporter ATP-binding protein EcfA2
VVITGPSGCGKSTLALAIGGYLFRQYDGQATGTVTVAGMDVRRTPIYDVAEVVGLVQQNPEAQFCTLTVQDEVTFGLENRCLPPEEIRSRVAWALEVVGASHLVQRPLATLSGGEKQKVAIAAVMAARPQVLIFDEPTSNLDPTATAEIFEVIARIRARAGLTVLVIEHKVEYLRHFSPRMVVLAGGRVVYDGPMDAGERVSESASRQISESANQRISESASHRVGGSGWLVGNARSTEHETRNTKHGTRNTQHASREELDTSSVSPNEPVHINKQANHHRQQ